MNSFAGVLEPNASIEFVPASMYWDPDNPHDGQYVWSGGRLAAVDVVRAVPVEQWEDKENGSWGLRVDLRPGVAFDAYGVRVRYVSTEQSPPFGVLVVRDGRWAWFWIGWYLLKKQLNGLSGKLLWTFVIWGLVSHRSLGAMPEWRNFALARLVRWVSGVGR